MMKRMLILLFLLTVGWTGAAFGDDMTVGGTDTSSDVILAGDRINIRVYREEELSAYWSGVSVGYAVDAAGNLNFPLVGPIHAEGLTIEQFQARLTEALSEYIVNPQLTVSFYEKQINLKVSILGQVMKSGKYEFTKGMTITQLISQAGGFVQVPNSVSGMKSMADTTKIQITRKDSEGKEQVMMVDVQSIVDGRQPDVILQPNDLVVVPEKGSTTLVSILGQVNKPGNYELISSMSLVQLISSAQGFTRLAAQDQVILTRESAGQKSVRTVDLNKIMTGRAEDLRLEAGDIVFVPESSF